MKTMLSSEARKLNDLLPKKELFIYLKEYIDACTDVYSAMNINEDTILILEKPKMVCKIYYLKPVVTLAEITPPEEEQQFTHIE